MEIATPTPAPLNSNPLPADEQEEPVRDDVRRGAQAYLTESVYQVVLQKSIPVHIRQLTLNYC